MIFRQMFWYKVFSQLNFFDLAWVSLGESKLHFEDEHICHSMLFWFPIFRHVGFLKSYVLCFPIRITLCFYFEFHNFRFLTFVISEVLYFELKKCQSCYFLFSTFGYGKLKNLDFVKVVWCFKFYSLSSYYFHVISCYTKSILILNSVCIFLLLVCI